MNNQYYRQTYPEATSTPPIYPQTNNQATQPTQNQAVDFQQIFLENNLFLNLGRTATFHMSFPDSQIERDKTFYGVISEVARDHVVIGDPNTGKWYMLPLNYLNFVEFSEKPVLFQQLKSTS